jgi:hypothetical protein
VLIDGKRPASSVLDAAWNHLIAAGLLPDLPSPGNTSTTEPRLTADHEQEALTPTQSDLMIITTHTTFGGLPW